MRRRLPNPRALPDAREAALLDAQAAAGEVVSCCDLERGVDWADGARSRAVAHYSALVLGTSLSADTFGPPQRAGAVGGRANTGVPSRRRQPGGGGKGGGAPRGSPGAPMAHTVSCLGPRAQAVEKGTFQNEETRQGRN